MTQVEHVEGEAAHRPRNYADSHAVIRLSAKRFAASPWLDHYRTDDMVMGLYSGRLYPLSLGADPIDDYWHLRTEVGLFDVPEHPIEVAGPDAERFLDHVLTRDMSTVPPGRARYALACDANGGILMDGVLIRWASDRFWYVMADGDFVGWLRAHAQGFDVTITDPGVWVLQVQGPSSLHLLRELCGDSTPDPFPYFAAATTEIAGQQVLITRTGWTGELGFEIYAAPEIDHDALWNGLLKIGAPLGLRACSLECMGIRRIEAGILDNGTDMDPSMTPFHAGLGAFVDFSKADFLGRDALAAADQTRQLFGASGPEAPVPGAEVMCEGEVVGRVRAGAWSPSLECGVGYVQITAPGEWLGREVVVAGVDGAFLVCDLPFLDPERNLPRGFPLAEATV